MNDDRNKEEFQIHDLGREGGGFDSRPKNFNSNSNYSSFSRNERFGDESRGLQDAMDKVMKEWERL